MTTWADIIQVLGLRRAKTTKEEYHGPCPWCGGNPETADRFMVWPDEGKYYCRHECNIDSGGTLSWLIRCLNQMGYRLTDPEGAQPKKEVKFEPLELKDYVEPDVIEQARKRNPKRVHEYYGGFGLTPDDCERWHLGYWQNGHRGFVLPTEVWDTDTHCFTFGAQIRLDPGSPDFKFMSIDGSHNAGFSNNRLITIPGVRQGPYLDYLFICEDRKSAMLLSSLDYHATAFKPARWWYTNLPAILSNIMCPIVVQDNDGGRGRELAVRFEQYAKRQCLRVAVQDFKQPSDLAAVRGRDAVREWIKETIGWIEDTGLLQ